ncbi:hypothetical protein DFQ30_002272, partial [Apophysomyces sp. BC1015]
SFAPIPKFDDRFARQNRYGLPSEFPLTSPYSGIVHHLSGPIMGALSRSFQYKTSTPDGIASSRDSYHDHFHYAYGFGTQILARMVDSLVRVSRRVV